MYFSLSLSPTLCILAFCKEKDKEKKLDDDSSSLTVPQSAFLGPTLWDKTLPYDGDTFQLEYMDLEEFLSENGIPPSPAQHDHSPHQPALQQATSATPSVMDLSSRASTSVHPTMVSPNCMQSPVRPGKSAMWPFLAGVGKNGTGRNCQQPNQQKSHCVCLLGIHWGHELHTASKPHTQDDWMHARMENLYLPWLYRRGNFGSFLTLPCWAAPATVLSSTQWLKVLCPCLYLATLYILMFNPLTWFGYFISNTCPYVASPVWGSHFSSGFFQWHSGDLWPHPQDHRPVTIWTSLSVFRMASSCFCDKKCSHWFLPSGSCNDRNGSHSPQCELLLKINMLKITALVFWVKLCDSG